MNPVLAFLAPLALLVPPALGERQDNGDQKAELLPVGAPAPAPGKPDSLMEPVGDVTVEQVRIEQRVIVRVAPPGPALRRTLVAPPAAPLMPRISERKMGKCVPVAGIAAVQPDSTGKLLLFMRDRRLVSANLEKACSARDFYSGFYLERSADGMLCVDRDKLHSRAGANCSISRIRQLVATDD